MVVTFSIGGPASGPRPIDPNRDFPQLSRLLRTVFAGELESGGQQVFENAASGSTPAIIWRFDPFLSKLLQGFVWEEDGQIVGNVTLLSTRSPQRVNVANVAILPEYRRRGIARALMEEVEKEARQRGAAEIRLQVARDNDAALKLYQSMGYGMLGSTTTWKLSSTRRYGPLSSRLSYEDWIAVRELPGKRWQEAYRLDFAAHSEDLHWPEPLASDEYRRDLLRRIANFFSGRHNESWVVMDDSNNLIGLAHIGGEWGRPHQLSVSVHPSYRGRLEAALVQKLVGRLAYLPRRRAILLHEADDEGMNEILPAVGFRAQRTLAHMQLMLR